MAREMKDSGFAWIGEIPIDWCMMKMNMICSVVTDYVASGSFADLAENVKYLDEPDYAMLVRTADVSKKGHVSKPVYINKHAYDFLSNSNLFGGELLLPNIGAVGEIYIVPKLYEKMSLAPNAIICKTNYCDKYYYYFFYCEAGRHSVIEISQSTAQAKFNKTDFRQIRGIVPPIHEQEQIASFLDTECSRIDSVIEQTRASIEEYKKLKQAVITQAVTKGIRPNREMKDSGIEWVGEMPSEWEMTRIKYISSKVGDGLHAAPEFEDNGLYYFINGNNLGDKQIRIKDNTNSVSEEEYSKYNQPVLCSNAILIALNGTYGLVSFYDSERIMLGKSAGYINLFLKINRNFVRYALLSDYSKRQMDDSIAGTTIANISLRTIKNITITWPPENEQDEISLYLDSKCAEIDSLLAEKAQLLFELESYKKSLIYAYVTGKKEVPA